MSSNQIIITIHNFESLIREKKINFDDLKNLLCVIKIKNIYYEIAIKSYFGYDKYMELLDYFTTKTS